MKKLYEKSEIGFAILWIALYVVGTSVADEVSKAVGHTKLLTLVFHAALSVFLLCWLKRHKLFEKYGLKWTDVPASKFAFFIPLVAISACDLWCGVQMNFPPADSLVFALSMLCVGFLEEIIFRGFLFKAMSKSNVRSAVIVSAVTFGAGHIVNMFNGHGAELVETLCQICYAVAFGFLFVLIFHRSKTLVPCILSHSFIDVTSVFSVAEHLDSKGTVISSLVVTALILVYIAVLLKTLPKGASGN